MVFQCSASSQVKRCPLVFNLKFWPVTVFLLNVFFCLAGLNAQQSNIRIEKYTVADGLSHNCVSGITQDKNGFIWVSTFAGLDRFDGYTFKNYVAKAGRDIDLYGFTDIRSDSEGNIWSCAFSKFIFKYNDSLDRFDTYYFINKVPDCSFLKYFFDSRNNLWLGSGGSGIVYLKNGDDPKHLRHLDFGNTFMDSLIVRSIAEDSKGDIWVGCDNGLIRLTRKGDSITDAARYYYQGKDFLSQKMNMIYTMAIDHDDHLWAGLLMSGLREVDLNRTRKGKVNLLPPANEFRIGKMPGAISCDTIFSIEPGSNGQIFIRSCKGIDIFDTRTGKSTRLCQEGATKYNDIEEGSVTSALFYSREGILWIGSLDGLYKVTFVNSPFQTINNFKPDQTGMDPFKTSQVLSDSQQRLWVGTQGNGLHLGLPDKSGSYTFKNFYRSKSDTGFLDKRFIYSNRIYSLAETEDVKNWVGAGFFQQAIVSGSNVEFVNPATRRMPGDFYKSQADVNQIIEINDKLWVIYQEQGIKVYDTATWKYKELILTDSGGRSFRPYVSLDENNRIYLHNEVGIYRISDGLVAKGKLYIPLKCDTLYNILKRYIAFPRGKFIITKAGKGLNFWLPSINKGLTRLYLPDGDKSKLELVKEYNTVNRLSNNTIYDLAADGKGNIWISTQNGLNRLDPETDRISSFFTYDGLPDNRFNFGADRDKEGYLYFCNAGGVVKFHPDSVRQKPAIRNALITRIIINDRDISEYDELHAQCASYLLKLLNLRHNQNFLSFEFAAIDHLDNRNIYYQYRMDGLNNDWINSGTRKFAEYQDIGPGNYLFRVRASDVNGGWSSFESKIIINIIPPFWQRGWFYLIIVLITMAIIFIVVMYRELRLKKRNIWLEGQVREKTDQALKHRTELDQMKSRFYTNISHEFRTPLTLITNSAIEIEKDLDKNSRLKFTATILKACSRLLKLVNELLDLSKVEAGKLDLKVSEGDLASVVRLIWQTYLSDAERRGISYSFVADPEVMVCWFDNEFLSKTVHNLISNALKFTSADGAISISVDYHSRPISAFENLNNISPPFVEIRVSDTGKGISPDNIARIFDRFYQVDNSNTREYEGSGIGLSIVRELVNKHHGDIKVESELGKGSTFTVVLPVGKDHFSTDEIFQGQDTGLDEVKYTHDLNDDHKKNLRLGVLDIKKPLVLVVEDNYELRNFLTNKLSEVYRVAEAVNGEDALSKSQEMNPDIIISDIMMPKMDGVELCAAIKRNMITCHIPVILLTAKADIDSKLEGLRSGADDYLAKPFNEEELMVRIDNLLRQRQLLREKFFSSPLADMPGLNTNGNDETFMSELIKTIESEMMRSECTVDNIASKMNFSKRTLERKLKSLTSLTPVEFIKVVRIKHAAALISGKKTTISEAAYITGFTSLSHFTISFREITGFSPSEYLRNF